MSNKQFVYNLQGRFAIVTGAASGVGRATATLLAKSGCNLFLIDLNDEKLLIVGSHLKKKYVVGVECYSLDVSRYDDLLGVKDEIKHKFGKINILVNCVGVSIQQKKGEVDEDIFDKLIKINLKSVYLSSMIFGYHLMNKGGSIINISSIRGRTGTPSYSSGYAAAKAGVINLTKSLALELASRKVRVNSVAPGPTYPTSLSKNWNKKLRTEISSNIPLRRLARPEEIASAIGFLAADNSSYITGHTLDVNGGLWMN